MKKILVLSLVLLMLAMNALPALAVVEIKADPCQEIGTVKGTLRVALAGYIKGIDDDNQSVIVEVLVGNRLGEKCLEKMVLIETKSDTRFLLSGGTVIKFSDLEIDDPVSVNGLINNDITDVDKIDEWVADRITVGALLVSK
jgi:hypothetical protein